MHRLKVEQKKGKSCYKLTGWTGQYIEGGTSSDHYEGKDLTLEISAENEEEAFTKARRAIEDFLAKYPQHAPDPNDPMCMKRFHFELTKVVMRCEYEPARAAREKVVVPATPPRAGHIVETLSP